MTSASSRRAFLSRASLAGSASLAAAQSPAVAPRERPKVELLQVGVIAVGDRSHVIPAGGIWTEIMNQEESTLWPIRTSGMRITHCWDSRPEVAQDFANRWKCENVPNYYDMVGKVDAMIFAGFYECEWWPKLAKPYIEAGIPCFINRPFALSMRGAREILDLAKQHNTPILCTDAHEDLKEGLIARHAVEDLVRQGRNVLGASATTDADDYTFHGVHGLYFVLPVFGMDVEKVSFQAPGWFSEITPTSVTPMDWGIITLQHGRLRVDDTHEQTKPFLTTVHLIGGEYGSRATLRVYHDGGWSDFDHHEIDARRDFINQRYLLQAKTIFNMQRMFETREMPQSYEDIARKTRIFLTGLKSHFDHDGAMTAVADLPEDWKAPSPRPGWIDESIFG